MPAAGHPPSGTTRRDGRRADDARAGGRGLRGGRTRHVRARGHERRRREGGGVPSPRPHRPSHRRQRAGGPADATRPRRPGSERRARAAAAGAGPAGRAPGLPARRDAGRPRPGRPRRRGPRGERGARRPRGGARPGGGRRGAADRDGLECGGRRARGRVGGPGDRGPGFRGRWTPLHLRRPRGWCRAAGGDLRAGAPGGVGRGRAGRRGRRRDGRARTRGGARPGGAGRPDGQPVPDGRRERRVGGLPAAHQRGPRHRYRDHEGDLGAAGARPAQSPGSTPWRPPGRRRWAGPGREARRPRSARPPPRSTRPRCRRSGPARPPAWPGHPTPRAASCRRRWTRRSRSCGASWAEKPQSTTGGALPPEGPRRPRFPSPARQLG